MGRQEASVGIDDLARILRLIAEEPNARRFPRPGDIEGKFDQWFDGGARLAHTGGRTFYDFANGDRACVDNPFGGSSILVILKDGRRAKIDRAWTGE